MIYQNDFTNHFVNFIDESKNFAKGTSITF